MHKRICVVGGGYWGKNHINSLHKLGALKGIVEPNRQLLNYYTNKFQEVSCYDNLNFALKESFDGFVVATPSETHYSVAKKIINAGNHVLIEKPMALSISDAEELVYLANKNKIHVMVGHVLLFHPAIIKMKEIIKKGKIGNLQYIYSNRLNLGKIRTEENVFWSLAPHDIAIFQFLTESYPKNIKAIGSTFLQEGIPDSTLTHIEYENQVEGHIFVSWLHPFKEHRLVAIGSESMISFEDSLEGKPLNLYSKKINLENGIPEQIDGPVERISYENKMPLMAELEYFIEHLGQKKPKKADMHHALEVVRILVEASQQFLKK